MLSALQVSIDGLLMGAAYGLGGIGFGLLYRLRRRIDLAYGACLMVGLYVTVASAIGGAGVNILALVAGLLASCAALAYCHSLCFPLRDQRPPITAVAASFALSMQIEEAVTLFMPSHFYAFPVAVALPDWRFGSIAVRPDQALVAASSGLLVVLLSQFLQHSRAGRALRASSENSVAASLCGISPLFVWLLTVALSSLVGGAAAIAIAMIDRAVSPMLGLSLTLKAFVVFAIGGTSGLRGPLVGGYALGLMEAHADAILGAQFRNMAIFALLFAWLTLSPMLRRGLQSSATYPESA